MPYDLPENTSGAMYIVVPAHVMAAPPSKRALEISKSVILTTLTRSYLWLDYVYVQN